MTTLNLFYWVPWIPWLLVGYISWDAVSPVFYNRRRYLIGNAYLALYALASFWQGQVTNNAPSPYLDEIFHIPQAQAYCSGDFHIWDPKLTTPPGLYAFTTLLGNLGGIRSCNVSILRSFNTIVLTFIMAYVSDCRALIERSWKRKDDPDDLEHPSSSIMPSTMHNAFNVALFPPLFFFSGLFYTDVLSTCVVLRTYRLFLQRKGSGWVYLAGMMALTMRQTNIFWVAVFLGGLEAVRAIKSVEVGSANEEKPQTWKQVVTSEFQRYSKGEIHDVPLKDAEMQDFGLCAISIAVAVLYHPIYVVRRLWPYMALLISFACFVFWNGGVVLGDKSNHVATIHLPQLLYLSAFTAFFSMPLLVPSILAFLQPFISLLIPSLRPSPSSPSSPRPTWKVLATGTLVAGSLVIALAIIHSNTLIHPFTLADNRHYVFYVFRYTILFHPLLKYLLAPVYLFCIYLSYRALSGSPTPIDLSPDLRSISSRKSELRQRLQDQRDGVAGVIPKGKGRDIAQGPTTSFFLIWLLSTALSLITAPLVEPRYFIIPWVIWRLHVPPTAGSGPSPAPSSGRKRMGRRKGFDELLKRYDYRLWLETLWFLAINGMTGYVFLYKGFEWPQEPGAVQRFMW